VIATRLLIVEDDRRIAEIQRRFIERLEMVELCGIAHSLADAREQIDILEPDLVLLDVYFPDGNGLELLRELRANNSHSDVILITAAKEVAVLRAALRSGVFDYILKPLVFERLHEAITRYQEHQAKLASLRQLGQNEVDALLPRTGSTAAASPQSRLPKGVDSLTLEKVRNLLPSRKRWNAEEMGTQMGASRTTARRYLEFLVGEGELSAEVAYGSVGRPERQYCPSAKKKPGQSPG